MTLFNSSLNLRKFKEIKKCKSINKFQKTIFIRRNVVIYVYIM